MTLLLCLLALMGAIILFKIISGSSNNTNTTTPIISAKKDDVFINDVVKKESELELTDEHNTVLDLLNNTRESVFITGKAGTGKSTLLRYFVKNTNKTYVILGPTGLSALNVGGQTVFAFFNFPPKRIIPSEIRVDFRRALMFLKIDMIIIDEVSMVRADLMDGIDTALRKYRNKNEPFGGVQMVLMGDLFQLPPVLTEEDRDAVLNTYTGQYFFDAPVFLEFKYHFCELTKIFRQSEDQESFKTLLNNIRVNEATFYDLALLNSRHIDNLLNRPESIFLTATRAIAKRENTQKLNQIIAESFQYLGSGFGKYCTVELAEQNNEDEDKLNDKLPAPYRLILKEGAQIMMLKMILREDG